MCVPDALTVMNTSRTPPVAPFSIDAVDVKFPAMPHTLAEVLRLRARGVPDNERLIEIVQMDPAITANVLRRVNAAYYGISRKIVQVDKAVSLLGYREVYGLVLTAVVKQALAFRGMDEAAAIHRHVMKNSLATAAFARHLAGHLNMVNPDIAFTAGMLHQIGRLVFLNNLARPYLSLWLRLSPARSTDVLVAPSPAMEQFLFKTDYTRLGTALAHQWGLPEEITAVIQAHQDPATLEVPYLRTLALVVAVSQAAAAGLFEPAGHDDEIAALLDDLVELRSADAETLATLLASHRAEARRFAEAMLD